MREWQHASAWSGDGTKMYRDRTEPAVFKAETELAAVCNCVVLWLALALSKYTALSWVRTEPVTGPVRFLMNVPKDYC